MKKSSGKGLTGASGTTRLPFLPDGGVDEPDSTKKKLKKVLTGTGQKHSLPFLPDSGTFFEKQGTKVFDN